MKWILILTISEYSHGVSTSIESVSGFDTQQSCLVAGSAWLEQNYTRFDHLKALCVSTSEVKK